MFRGSYELRTDEKGRIIVPLKFRAQLGENFIITKGTEKCLFVMTENEWRQSFEEKFTTDLFLDRHLFTVERFFRDGLVEASVDSQGRVGLSQKLRDYAGIAPQSDVVLIGMSKRLELWSKARWDEVSGAVSDDDVLESAAVLGMGALSLKAPKREPDHG